MIESKDILNLVDKYRNNKLSHVFLIETNNKEKTLKDIKEFVKVLDCLNEYTEKCDKCNICHLIDKVELPSLLVINPDGQVIKKGQMEELKNTFAKKPLITKFNVYIINDAEKFNSSSANTMLKFIEEPTENLIGFLITNNKENVIETIKSRCEIIRSIYNDENAMEANESIKKCAFDFINYLEDGLKETVLYNKKIIDLKLEKNDYEDMFQLMLKYYTNLLINDTTIVENNCNLSKKELLKRIKIINEVIERLNYNVNINLLLDYLVLRWEE